MQINKHPDDDDQNGPDEDDPDGPDEDDPDGPDNDDDPDSPGDDDPDGSEDESNTFNELFKSFSNQWVQTQLCHKVSLTAACAFWKLSFKYVKDIYDKKAAEVVTKKIPQYVTVKKNIYKDQSPDVKMKFTFRNKIDNTIFSVEQDKTPVKQYQRDPKYEKLYEEAKIEVIVLSIPG